jgi:hypothetical protein
MECGDLSPLLTGQFIGPPGMARGGRGGEINGRLPGSALEIAVKSRTKVPHSIREVLKIQFLTANERQWTRILNKIDLADF